MEVRREHKTITFVIEMTEEEWGRIPVSFRIREGIRADFGEEAIDTMVKMFRLMEEASP